MVCNSCSEKLAQAVDSGVVPAWLPTLITNSTRAENHSAEQIETPSTLSTDSLATIDRFQKIRLQGEGGMGQVWQGWDAVMKRTVALKQLRSGTHNLGRDRRLLQEAASLARLSHPNIVAVHEVIVLNELTTLVMEFVNGPTLAGINRDFVMSERHAAKIVERLADAISHAHQQGVIHRDLKPANVLLCWPGESLRNTSRTDARTDAQSIESAIPKLTDFGLAKVLEGDDLTRTGELIGTPAYMAPEQTLGLTSFSGQSSDIYGLGAILYDLLTGTPPHVAENPVATMLLVREREPTAPRLLRRELSKDMETICLKCLQKLPKDRYASASALREDLVAFLDGRPISARPDGITRTAIRWSGRHKSIVATAILAVSLVLTLLFGSLWTVANERRLRIAASEAKTQAELSEKKFIAEAERANHALDINREHFEVALDHVNRLAHLAYNPNNKAQNELDYNREIRQATQDIYATYLDTLPAPEQWTLYEANAVTMYVKYMGALKDKEIAAPWLERVKGAIPRLERNEPDSPKLRQFLFQHYQNASIYAYAIDDYIASGKYGEQAGRFVDIDARQAAFVLMNSAIAYNRAGCGEDAVRAANNSVAAYRTVLDQPNPNPDDSINFLDNLKWHRHVATEAGNKKEADKHLAEVEERARRFDTNSQYYARVREIMRAVYNRPE